MKKNNLIILLISCLSLFSCSSSKKINMFFYSDDDEFITELSDQLKDKLSPYFDIEINYADNSQSTQNYQIVDAISTNSNLIVVNTVDRLASSSIVEKAATKNIPLIFVNREPLIEDIISYDNAYYVGTDSAYEGKLQAKIAHNLFQENGGFVNSRFDKNHDGILQIVLIKGEQGHQDSEERSQNSISQLKIMGYNVQILESVFCDWSRDIALESFHKIYNHHQNEIELVISCNDEMALGCSDYLKTLPDYDSSQTILDQYFPIIGVNGRSLGIEAIKNGDIYGTVTNDSSAQADAIYQLAMRLLNNQSLSDFPYTFDRGKFIRTKGEILTLDTLEEKQLL